MEEHWKALRWIHSPRKTKLQTQKQKAKQNKKTHTKYIDKKQERIIEIQLHNWDLVDFVISWLFEKLSEF